MAKKKKSGGRNPVEPSKRVVLVGFYTQQSNVDHFGSLQKCREWCKETLEIAVDFEKKEKSGVIRES